jgi:hypothetical protein
MSMRSRRARLELSLEDSRGSATPAAAAPSAGQPTAGPATDAAVPADADLPYVEPEQYGVRTTWQSEAVRIEAAEFLLATRVQEEKQWRLSRMVDRLRLARRAEGDH